MNLVKKKQLNCNFFLLYGNNRGLIEETINNDLRPTFTNNLYNYDESDILKNPDNFKEDILSKSFFEDEKLIIISRASDKIYKIITEIIERKITGITIIIKSSILEKKSKIRNYFEKNRDTICIPFYEDNLETLSQIAQKIFSKNKIAISEKILI